MLALKAKEPTFLPQNRCPVALLFKDGEGLANHPLSCHPQGVFGSRENETKANKMRERKSRGKNLAWKLYIQQRKNENVSTRFYLSLYSNQISKNTQIPSIPIIHEGQNWKNQKKEVKRGSTEQKPIMQEAFFKFRNLPNFLQCSIFLAFSALLSF